MKVGIKDGASIPSTMEALLKANGYTVSKPDYNTRTLHLAQIEKIVAAYVTGPTTQAEHTTIMAKPIREYDASNPLLKTIQELIMEAERLVPSTVKDTKNAQDTPTNHRDKEAHA